MYQLNIAQQAARALIARLALSGIVLVPAIFVRLCLPDIAPSLAAPAQQSRSFQPTGYAVGGSFLSFFDAHGGVTIFGYPISDRVTEGGRPVQYFERQRFEYHSEAAGTSNAVQLGRLGAELAPTAAVSRYSAPFDPTATRVFFPQTRHSLSGAFLAYWRASGDVTVLGYPVTEPLTENGLLVQYFERARMEYHPEKASAGYAVELGALGRQYLSAHLDVAARLAAAPRSASPDSRGSQPSSQPRLDNTLSLSAKESELLQRINDAREAMGVGLVSLDRTLKSIALSRSQDMVARNYFSHTTPDGLDFLDMMRAAGVRFKFAGEIIANNNYKDQETAYVAYNSFMDSPRHRDIMLDRRYSLAGVGEATNGAGYHFFTVIFVQR